MYLSVLIRTLRPGKTYEDFVKAWYPDRGFGVGGRGPLVAQAVGNEREILTFGFIELDPSESLEEAGARIAEQEAVRHERVAEVIESTTVRGLYELVDEFDFMTDEGVERGRPPYVDR
jgi:hypothetical protein